METITVTFDHPDEGTDGEVFARISVSGFPGQMFLGPGDSGEFTDVAPDTYRLFVQVGTLAGASWSIDVAASTGFSKSKKGTGPDSFIISVPITAALGGSLRQRISLAAMAQKS
jgi:hypothetical protein